MMYVEARGRFIVPARLNLAGALKLPIVSVNMEAIWMGDEVQMESM